MIHKLYERDALGRRTARGLSCDKDGVRFGGGFVLVEPHEEDGHQTYRVCAIERINKAFSAGYGVPTDLSRHLPTLTRVAELLTEGRLGHAQLMVLQMGLPDLPDDTAEEQLKRVDPFIRFNPNHQPAGPGGGQFTSRTGSGVGSGASAQEGRSSSLTNAAVGWSAAGTIDERQTTTVVSGNQIKILATTVGLFPLGQAFVVDAEPFGMEADGHGNLRVIPNAGPSGSAFQMMIGGPVSAGAPVTQILTARVPSPTGVYTWRLFRNVGHDDPTDAEADVDVKIYVRKSRK